MKFFPAFVSTVIVVVLGSPAAAEDGLLPNPSFEQVADGRPEGFRNFLSPAGTPPGDNFVLDGMEGDTTHTGRRALQFHFPDGAEIIQSVWMADARPGGCRLEPGSYTCSFWVKAEGMLEGFHLWVTVWQLDADNKKAGQAGRSGYLRASDLLPAGWKQISFDFDVADGPVSVAPSVTFKTSPDGLVRPVPADTRLWVDDLQIVKN